MRIPFKSLRSVKLAIGLIAYLALGSAGASFLPQNRGARFYGSLLFLIPAFLFFANLAACAAYRLSCELKKERKKRRHGPDIIHLGLVLLMTSVVAGQAAERLGHETQGFVRLAAGEAVQLSEGRILVLKSLREDRYPDGRPENWASVVQVWKDGLLLVPDREIRVNRPLRLGALSIRQASYGTEGFLKLAGPSGEARSLPVDGTLDLGDGTIRLISVDTEASTALAREESSGRELHLGIGSRLGSFEVTGAEERKISGLMASYDPLYPAILASLIIAALGIGLTLAQKLRGGMLE